MQHTDCKLYKLEMYVLLYGNKTWIRIHLKCVSDLFWHVTWNRKQTRSQHFNDRIPAFVSAFFFRSNHVSIKQLLRVTKRLRAYYITYLNLREFRREKFFRYAGHSGISLSSVYKQVRGVDWKLFWLDTTLTHPTGEGNSWKKI